MHAILIHIEQLQVSTVMRESGSLWAFPMFLFLHTLGMSIVVGGNVLVNVAVLGFWPKIALRPLARFYPICWWAFALNAITGTVMFMKDASSYGANIDFYVKLGFVFAGIALLPIMQRRVFGDPALDTAPRSRSAKVLALISLTCWLGAVVAGRLMAYLGPVPGL